MELTDVMKKSLSDFKLAQAALRGGAEVTDTLVAIVGRWYENVEIVYPIPDMELSDDASRDLSLDILSEMVTEAESAVPLAEADPDVFAEHGLPAVAAALDGLWLEFARANAKVLNKAFELRTAEIDVEEAQEILSDALEALAQATGMPIEEVREQARRDPVLRNGLRQMGIDPDTI